jgi:uncharacterized protein
MNGNPPPRFPGGDVLPWYRQFWPWFLISLPATVVVAALTTVVIANRGADDLVVDDYYKNGLAINRQLEKQQRAQQLGISATVLIDGPSVVVQTRGRVSGDALQLHLSHPLEADRDFELALKSFGSGIYRGHLRRTPAPRWHWVLESPGEKGWRLDGTLGDNDFVDVDN